MRKLSTEKRAAVLAALVEGSSVNATSRMCGVSKITVLRLLADAGHFCIDYHNKHVQNVASKRVQVDEIWGFCGCKDKAKEAGAGGLGSIWTWTALDADSKLMITWLVADRTVECAISFMKDVKSRLSDRVQLTTDGYHPYREAVGLAFYERDSVDYAMLIKKYGPEKTEAGRYSPPVCIGADKKPIRGNPDPEQISTSFAERSNLTMRMGMRRMTRLTNAFSKKLENHRYAAALHFVHYNFIRKHMTLKTTPAVAAGIATRPLTILDLVHLIELEEEKTGGRLTDYLASPDGD